MTIQQIQTAIDDKVDLREIVNMLADYVQANPGSSGLSYDSWVAAFSQSGANVPVVSELENTIGLVQWQRSDAGVYIGVTTIPNANLSKVYLFGSSIVNGFAWVTIPVATTNAVVGYIQINVISGAQFCSIEVDVYNSSFNLTEWSSLMGASKIFLPEIRVYP